MQNESNEVLNRIITLCEKAIHSPMDPEDDDTKYVMDAVSKLPDYFNEVVMGETRISLSRIKYEDDPESMRDAIEKIDQSRRDAHQALTRSINMLNRLAQAYDSPAIFPSVADRTLDMESLEDRELAARTCFSFCCDMFLKGKERELHGKGINTRQEYEKDLYSIMQNRELSFDTESIKRSTTLEQFKSLANERENR